MDNIQCVHALIWDINVFCVNMNIYIRLYEISVQLEDNSDDRKQEDKWDSFVDLWKFFSFSISLF